MEFDWEESVDSIIREKEGRRKKNGDAEGDSNFILKRSCVS